ncbi:MAG TPA: hypothetical protein VGQ33_10435 [Vicinamibacteria bacterium]|nr:hypothetical protein [Vicinamibacteria bacterium]
MKWVNIYFLGYVILVIGVVAALAKMGVIHRIGAGWTAIGIVIAIGLGIMFAVSGSGQKESIDINRN